MNAILPSLPQYFPAENRQNIQAEYDTAPVLEQEEVVVDHFPFVIGRHPECDFSLAGRHISRRHCQLFLRGGEIWVEDLNSYNGTFVNGREIHQAEPVYDGTRLTLFPYHFQCRIEEKGSRPVELILLAEGKEETAHE
jgi:pSer/pThr/pTyr-binding forkhead associated (FHA) protein